MFSAEKKEQSNWRCQETLEDGQSGERGLEIYVNSKEMSKRVLRYLIVGQANVFQLLWVV